MLYSEYSLHNNNCMEYAAENTNGKMGESFSEILLRISYYIKIPEIIASRSFICARKDIILHSICAVDVRIRIHT